MQPRTEDQVITKAPVEITLGDSKYLIKPLPIGKAIAWRQKLTSECAQVLASFEAKQTTVNMGHGLTAALLAFPEKMTDLLLAYSPELDGEKIKEEATEEQVALAFGQVMQVAYPFLIPLETVKKVLK